MKQINLNRLLVFSIEKKNVKVNEMVSKINKLGHWWETVKLI